jgi:tetratricopeptide (TPR) repeat protein
MLSWPIIFETMLTIRLFVITFLVSASSFGQSYELSVDQLSFYSPYEQKVFTEHFRKGNSDAFSMLMANGSLLTEKSIADTRAKFTDFLKRYDEPRFRSKKPDKQVKTIYDDVHKTFFLKYKNNALFEEIFSNGHFNSLTASALYALAFQELNIPFAIKQVDDQVYVVAYPNAEQIKLEATNPAMGIFQMSPEFKQAYLQSLKEKKIISTQEYAAKDAKTLFNQYYYGNSPEITIAQLVGLLYLDDAIAKTQVDKKEDAFIQSEKAYICYPSERTLYVMAVTGSDALQARTRMDSTHATYVGKISSYNAAGITPDMIQSEYARVINHLLFDKGDRGAIDNYRRVMMRHVQNIQLANDLDFLYQYEVGRSLYNQGRYRDGLPFFEEALKLRPANQETQNIVISSLAIVASKLPNAEAIEITERYSSSYPSLRENNRFNLILATTYLIQFEREYFDGKVQRGEKFKTSFEELMAKYKDISVDGNLVGHAYSTAAVYYFKQGQNSKAKTYINKGLEFAPNNYELQNRRQQIH